METVGIDLHLKRSRYVMLNQEGRVIAKRTIASTPQAFRETFGALEARSTQVAMEATINWYWAVDIFDELGIDVRLANPHKVRLIAESTIKTDTVDATALAQLLRMGWLPESRITPQKTRLLRERLRYRITLVRMRTSIKNRIHAVLAKVGIRPPELKDLFGKTGRLWLENLELPSEYKENLDGYLRTVDSLSSEIHEVDIWLKKRMRKSEDIKLLMEIPGIGIFSAALILAEIGDIEFFKSKRKLSSFVGVVPGTHNSDRKSHDTGLKKDSNRYIRWLLAEAAPKAKRAVPTWQRLYDRVYAGNPKRKSTAKVAVMHKIVGAIWRVLKTREKFNRLHNCPELQTTTASPQTGTGLK